MKGKFVTVYIPEHLVKEWGNIENKSRLVQEAIERRAVTKRKQQAK